MLHGFQHFASNKQTVLSPAPCCLHAYQSGPSGQNCALAYVGHQWQHLRYERRHFVIMWLLIMPLHQGFLPSAVALPCLWAVLHWTGKRCIASQKHTTAASFCGLLPLCAASPDPPSPRWRPRGSGWSDGRCCGCCWALVHPSSRWSCSETCEIRSGVPLPLCFPLPLSHQIPPRWTTDLTSCSRSDATPLQIS